jgi:hypothetical protein
LRRFVLTLLLAAPLLLALAGCGSGKSIETTAPDQAVKASEDSYNAEIARQKAAAKRPR